MKQTQLNKVLRLTKLLQRAEETTSRQEAKELINQATAVKKVMNACYRYGYSGLN